MSYDVDDLHVSMRSGQVQGSVIAHVGGVNSCSSFDEQLDDVGVSSLGSPVQRRKLMIIPVE